MANRKTPSSSWSNSNKSIRAVQVVFELEQMQSRILRVNAINHNLSPSDYIRDILELPRKKPVRPRLSVTLSESDYAHLAKRYNIDPSKKNEIRELIKKDLIKACED